MGAVLALAALLVPSLGVGATYTVDGGVIERDGQEIQLFGVSWFGAETQDHVPHGLWTRNYAEMAQQIRAVGFNAVRLGFCPETLQNVAPNSINYFANPSLVGLGSLEI